jgi:CBS domain-containing membrane protein
MQEGHFRHIPIVNEFDELIGLISERDIYKHSVSCQAYMPSDELEKIETGTLLFDVMVRDPVTITPDSSIRHAAELIYRNKYGCLPVVDDQAKLVGIITSHDFVGTALQLLEIIEASEPLEIDDIQ